MKKNISDSLNKNDFKLLRHQFLMRNESSQTEVIDISMIQLLEIKAAGLVLKMPHNSCRTGHLLSLYMFSHPEGKSLKKLPQEGIPLKGANIIIGKVKEMSVIEGSGFACVEIVLSQFDEEEWRKIYLKYENHQKEINEIIKKSRP